MVVGLADSLEAALGPLLVGGVLTSKLPARGAGKNSQGGKERIIGARPQEKKQSVTITLMSVLH